MKNSSVEAGPLGGQEKRLEKNDPSGASTQAEAPRSVGARTDSQPGVAAAGRHRHVPGCGLTAALGIGELPRLSPALRNQVGPVCESGSVGA